MTDEMTVEQWLTIRKEAGLKIDPETAKVIWDHRQVLDPYGVNPDLTEEEWCVGRSYFACAPGSDIWVSFYDLPDTTRTALWKRLDSGLTIMEDNCDWLSDAGDDGASS